FDDPKLLDDCPFVCKIGKNVDGDTKYFGVAYGDETIQKQMKEWAKKFRRATLLNESGDQILEEIKTEIHPDKK
ncbi:hypothetical protein HY967_05065, partial [Candidatus Jorgensenbacteria bacterium]|nr:hypothetical protein [Candidatus Jorgensenbacteria bacterium]